MAFDVQDAIIPVNEWESFEERRVRYGEHRGIDPDTERKDRNGHGGEAGLTPHLTQRIGDVLL